MASPTSRKAGGARIARPYTSRPVYDLAPKIRPLVFVGPSKLGCPVTDRMQQALINYLRRYSQWLPTPLPHAVYRSDDRPVRLHVWASEGVQMWTAKVDLNAACQPQFQFALASLSNLPFVQSRFSH
jgi:hypothetical protein